MSEPLAGATVTELLKRGDNEVFRQLVDSVRDYAIFLLTPQGYIASWNAGAERIKGYKAEEIIGRHFSVFYTDEAVRRGWPAEELKRAAIDGTLEDEGWRIRKDGGRFWANVVISRVRGAHGELLGFSKVTRDLTERRRAEQALRDREENLRLLVEGVKDHAMLLLDAKGRIRTWNSGAERLLGHRAVNVLGEDWTLLLPAEEVAAGHAQAMLASSEASGFLRAEGYVCRADGSRFWGEVAITALEQHEGRPQGFVEIIRDLSERRRVEELESEGRRIGEFIAMLSHELRNPLAPIRTATAVLRRLEQPEEAARCVEVIARQSDHLARLVDDLLDVSRITNGKIRLELAPVEMNTLVRMAVESTRSAVRERDHTLVMALGDEPITVSGDATRLTQVVVNLVINAAKYTPDGGQINVALRTNADVALRTNADVAMLQISDNGIGMNESLLERAFEPFVQGGRSLERGGGGLGIGLTLVKRIVELHSGSISAASGGTGQGTTMTVTLPLARRKVEGRDRREALEASTADETEWKDTAPGCGPRLLLVDDNRDAAESLAAFLRLEGAEVHVAADGPAAIAMARELEPEAVVLDIGLPGMNGLEVCRALRRLPGLRGARIVALTGYGQAADRAATSDAGFDAHLTKPVDPERLAKLLLPQAQAPAQAQEREKKHRQEQLHEQAQAQALPASASRGPQP
ncbi:MAG: PAS domain S-box protein [Rubrivivax sp.]